MVATATTWQRVSRANPCPICGRGHWCSVSSDEQVSICMRVSEGSFKGTRDGGFLHRLKDSPDRQSRPAFRSVPIRPPVPTRHDLPTLAERYRTSFNPARLSRHAAALGLTVESLIRLGIGWADDVGAWSFPMRDAAGTVLGIRLRLESGRKFSVTGGREGLFLPIDLPERPDRLIICEGPTDSAALLDLGFDVVGRPCATGGLRHLVDLVRLRRPAAVVVFADRDEVGQRGADILANTLAPYCPDVRTIAPPEGAKDARAWRIAGATAADVLAAVEAATPRTLNIRRVPTEAVHG